MNFKLTSKFKPKGSQPEAIRRLNASIAGDKKSKAGNFQTLLGVTGSGKTFTMANVIEKFNRPTLVIAHNKTLAAQLYNEFKEFFPENRVEYFVSYYDYYQPESYIPQKDQYIEKDSQVNIEIEKMRLATAASLSSRRDVIVVASVSCIYGLGNPENFLKMGFELEKGKVMERKKLLQKLVAIQFERNDTAIDSGCFRVKGDTVDFIPGYDNNIIRVEMFGDEIERIAEIDKITGEVLKEHDYFFVYPAKHFVVPEEEIARVADLIEAELEEVLANGVGGEKLDMIEEHRLKQRTMNDLEMIRETGFCKGIENYSRHFDGREAGSKPYCLLDYFAKTADDEFMIIIDESHQTIPQLHGMYNGDRSRKTTLVDYGFRLPSALDNRPLQFEEFEQFMKKDKVETIFVSATPGDYEKESSSQVVEQIIRPTGLVDPEVFVRKTEGQMEDLKNEIKKATEKSHRTLVTTITKRLAEELTDYLAEQGIKTRYLHSEIDTLERTEIIRELRLGKFDVLVGINLLREGLDIPEVGFIGILDADKEGFLRDTRSLIQTIGRAARNAEAKVVLYADKKTDSMKRALAETERRRKLQLSYNQENKITPQTIIKPVKEKEVEVKDVKNIPKSEIPELIIETEKAMQRAADELDFEKAIVLREKVEGLKKRVKK